MNRKLNRQSTWICCILSGLLNSQQVFAQAQTQASGQQQVVDASTAAIARNPRNSSAYFKRGKAYYLLGQCKEAIADFTQAISLDPRNTYGYDNRGNCYAALGHYKKAIEDFNKALKINPKDDYALSNREYAKSWLAMAPADDDGQVADLPPADSTLTTASSFSDDSEETQLLPNQDTTGEINVDHDAKAYCKRGHAYSAIGQHEKAIEDYTQALSIDPRDAVAYICRGQAYSIVGQHDKAIDDFDTAIGIGPKDALASAYSSRAHAYTVLGQLEKALEDCTTAIGMDATSVDAYERRGDAYSNLGQQQKAIADYTQALSIDPNAKDAEWKRKWAFNELKEKKGKIEQYTKAIITNPQDAEAYRNRAHAYLLDGQHAKAIEDFNKAIMLNPRDGYSYGNRGKTYVFLGQHQKAIDDCTKAIGLTSRYVDAFRIRGNAYANLGQYKKAVDDFSTAIALAPTDDDFYSDRAHALEALGLHEKPLDVIERAQLLTKQEKFDEAEKMLRPLAAKGGHRAEYWLANEVYMSGQCKCSRAARVEYYRLLKKSADCGFVLAQVQLADQVSCGSGIDNNAGCNDALARVWLLKAAKQGYLPAQLKLAESYSSTQSDWFQYCRVDTRNEKMDRPESLKWYRSAAKAGMSQAQYELGLTLISNDNPEEVKEGISWLEKVASGINRLPSSHRWDFSLEAARQLATICEEGKLVPKDSARALELQQKCAQAGDQISQVAMGYRYLKGDGVKLDYKQAFDLFDNAAVRDRDPDGSPPQLRDLEDRNATKGEAEKALSMMYAKALGVERDFLRAHRWAAAATMFDRVELTLDCTSCTIPTSDFDELIVGAYDADQVFLIGVKGGKGIWERQFPAVSDGGPYIGPGYSAATCDCRGKFLTVITTCTDSKYQSGGEPSTRTFKYVWDGSNIVPAPAAVHPPTRRKKTTLRKKH